MKNNNVKETAQKALASIAQSEGVSVAHVRREIEMAIAAARETGDADIQAFWNALETRNNGPLTAEDVIAYFAQGEMDENGYIDLF